MGLNLMTILVGVAVGGERGVVEDTVVGVAGEVAGDGQRERLLALFKN